MIGSGYWSVEADYSGISLDPTDFWRFGLFGPLLRAGQRI